jgi:hypothetical protein
MAPGRSGGRGHSVRLPARLYTIRQESWAARSAGGRYSTPPMPVSILAAINLLIFAGFYFHIVKL